MVLPMKFTFEEHAKKMQAAQAAGWQVRRGVYCDIQGTLVTPGGDIIEDTRALLRAFRENGHSITLISRVQDNALANTGGLTTEFGPVEAKALFRDSTVEILIDNNPSMDAISTLIPEEPGPE